MSTQVRVDKETHKKLADMSVMLGGTSMASILRNIVARQYPKALRHYEESRSKNNRGKFRRLLPRSF